MKKSLHQSTTQSTQVYQRGSIVRVKMVNFLTYDSCEVFPGKGLNVIIGPNGAGKSSIVCAIALSLGTAPKVLGRSKDLKDFVKVGQEKATVEIELSSGHSQRNNVVITRHFNTENKSTFYINSKSTSLKEVQALCKDYCIMIDNLCQFLPQERVAAFSALSPPDLLKETEKATGSAELEKQHTDIIEYQEKLNELRRVRANEQKDIDNLTHRVKGLEEGVGLLHEQQKRETKLTNLRNKLPWAIFEEKRKMALEVREQKEKMEEKITNLEEEIVPTERNFKAISDKINLEEERIDTSLQIQRDNNKKIGKLQSAKDQYEQDIEDQQHKINKAKKDKEENAQQIQQLKKQIEEIDKKMNDITDLSLLKAQSDENKEKLIDIRQQITLQQEKQEACEDGMREKSSRLLERKRELSKLNDIKEIRLRKIFESDAQVMTAYKWIEEHKEQFEERVYGPICVELDVEKEEYADDVETAIPIQILKGFVVTNKHDRELIIQNLAERNKLQIQVFLTDGDERNTQPTQLALQRSFGVISTLNNVISGPLPILNAVEDLQRLSQRMLCTKEANNHMTELHPGVYYTPDQVMNIVKSKYSANVTSRVNPVRKAKFLSTAVDANKRTELENQIREIEEEYDMEKKEAEKAKNEANRLEGLKRECSAAIEAYEKAKREGERYKKLKKSKENEIKQLEQEVNTEEIIEQCTKTIKKKQEKLNETVLEIGKTLKEVVRAKLDSNPSNFIIRIYKSKQIILRDLINENKRRRQTIQEELQRVSARYEDLKSEAIEKKKEAEEVCQLTDELQRIFEQYPDDPKEIEDEIEIENNKLAMRDNVEDNVEQLYEENKRELSKKLAIQQKKTDEINDQERILNETKESWLKTVKDVVSKIHNSFEDYMSEIGCSGKVELDEKEDYDKYGIKISTKFRKEGDLQQLNQHTQSGGERSVATMLYLLSLQDQTFCPFRLVDEINQGMDPLNERMIFSQIVKAVNKERTQQYFLVTPKLLSDLPFAQNMTVLCVMNGHIDTKPWDISSASQALKEVD